MSPHGQSLLLAAALLFGAALAQADAGLGPVAAHDQAQAGQLTLIDIRTPAEWRDTGVPEGAVRIEMKRPGGPGGFVEEVLTQVKGNRDAPIALICRSGNRSGQMQQALTAMGFTQVYSVDEGMGGSRVGPGWIRRGLPVVPCKGC